MRSLAASSDRPIPLFSFPYNHVGDTQAKRLAIKTLLASHGYRLAALTIDTSDYCSKAPMNAPSLNAMRAMTERIERAYLDHTRVQISYYGELGRKVLDGEMPAIILLHANRLNATTIGPLISLFPLAGYGFVSLARAQADVAYSAMPAVATKFGPILAYRWARERRVKVDYRLEHEPLAWISAYASKTP